MALRVLTTEEKESLKTNANFATKCYWAIRDYAAYWGIHDGGGLANETARLKWAKDRQNSVAIIMNDCHDQEVPLKFLKLAKGMEFDLDAAPLTPETIIPFIQAGNKFEELASMYFDMLGENINLSPTGN